MNQFLILEYCVVAHQGHPPLGYSVTLPEVTREASEKEQMITK